MNRFFSARRFCFLAALTALCVFSAACSKKQAPHVEQLPGLKLGVAQFTMPRTLGELLAGAIPAQQAPVDASILTGLDDALQEILKKNVRHSYVPMARSYRCYRKVMKDEATRRGNAMDKWVAVGKCMDVDVLLVPQLLYWHEREGGPMGIESPAAVILELFLLDVRSAQVLGRYRFEESQTSLTSNLLTLKKFVNRGGRWITANELAAEGMETGLGELGL